MITVRYYTSPTSRVVTETKHFRSLDEYLAFLNGDSRKVKGSKYAKVYSDEIPSIDGTEFNFA